MVSLKGIAIHYILQMQFLISFEYVDFEPCPFIKFCEKYNPARLLRPARLLGRWKYLDTFIGMDGVTKKNKW